MQPLLARRKTHTALLTIRIVEQILKTLAQGTPDILSPDGNWREMRKGDMRSAITDSSH